MNRRVAVRAVIVNDGKVLAMTPKPYHNDVSTGIWFTVGGTLEDTESLHDGLKREVLEEVGVEPQIGSLLYVHQFAHGGGEHLEFLFHVTNSEDFLNIDLSKTTHGGIEIEELKFIDPKNDKLYPVFLQEESFDNLQNEPTKFFSYL